MYTTTKQHMNRRLTTHKCDGKWCRDSSCQKLSTYQCPECDFRLCYDCVWPRDPRASRYPCDCPEAKKCPHLKPFKITEGLWAQPMEGLGDLAGLEDWNQPTERLWDSPTERVHNEPNRNRPQHERRGADQASSLGHSTDAVSTKSSPSASERDARRRIPQPRPRSELSVPSQPPLQRANELRHGIPQEAVREEFSQLWIDSPSEGVWDTPTAEGLWDGPMERVTNEEGDRRRRPPEYDASNETEEERPPSYDECVRLGMAN